MLSLPIHEHGKSLRLFRSQISFLNILQCSVYSFYTGCVRFTSKYLLGLFVFFFLSDYKWYYIFNFGVHSSLIICTNRTYLCIFVLIPVTLLKSLTSFRGVCFLVDSLGIFSIDNHVICEQRPFYFFQSNICAFYFLCLAQSTGSISCTMLAKVVRADIFAFFSNLQGKQSVSHH